MSPLRFAVLLASLCALLAPLAQAQVEEVEPNDTCAKAQVIDAAGVDGALTPGSGFSDYYRLNLPEGVTYIADALGAYEGAGTLEYPGLYRFTPTCLLQTSRRSRMAFKVPAAGVAVFLVSTYSGSGTYQVRFAPAVRARISARLWDRLAGGPVGGVVVYLNRCRSPDCSSTTTVANLTPGDDGIVSFPISATAIGDRYFLSVPWSGEVAGARSEIAQVTSAGQSIQLGHLDASSPGVAFVSRRGCASPLYVGEACDMVVTVENRTSAERKVRAWATLALEGTHPQSYPDPGSRPYLVLQLGADVDQPGPILATIAPHERADLAFKVPVPAGAVSGSQFYLTVYVAPARQPGKPYLAQVFKGGLASRGP